MPGPPVGAGAYRGAGAGVSWYGGGGGSFHGRGGGYGNPRPKAAPIARPSTDYVWKLEQRVYSSEEKKRREEARRAEAERRDASRAEGQDVDLGRAGAYWNQVANSSAKAPAFNKAYIPRGPAPGAYGQGGSQSAAGPVGATRVWRAAEPKVPVSLAKAVPPVAAPAQAKGQDPWSVKDPWGGAAPPARPGGSRQQEAEAQQPSPTPSALPPPPQDPWSVEDPWGGSSAARPGHSRQQEVEVRPQGHAAGGEQAPQGQADAQRWGEDAWWQSWQQDAANGAGAQEDVWREGQSQAVGHDQWKEADPWGGTEAWNWQQSWTEAGNGVGAEKSWDVTNGAAKDVANGMATSWDTTQWNASAYTVASAATPGYVPKTLERSFTKEEKARRAALRREQAEQRRRAQEQTEAAEIAVAPWATSTPPSSAIAEPAEEPSPTHPVKTIDLNLAGSNLSDDALAAVCERWRDGLAAGEAVWPASGLNVDIRNNQITDKGLADLVAFLCENNAQPEELLLTGNPLQEPDSLQALLKDKSAGIGGSGKLWCLDISSGQLTCKCFWKLLEICGEERARPPLRVGLLNGELGELRRVLEKAEQDCNFTVQRTSLSPESRVPSYSERLVMNADLELVHTEAYTDKANRDQALTPWQ